MIRNFYLKRGDFTEKFKSRKISVSGLLQKARAFIVSVHVKS